MQKASDWITPLLQHSSSSHEGDGSAGLVEGESKSLALSGSAVFFILRGNWLELDPEEFFSKSAKTLTTLPYMIRITYSDDRKIYFCSNDAVFSKLEGKERFWIYDLLAELWNETVKWGLKKETFWGVKFKQLLKLYLAHKVLGGTF